MVLHSIDPSERMLHAWDEWSEGSPAKYEPGVCAAKWATFRTDGGLQLGDLLRWAKQDSGWAPEQGPRPVSRRPRSGKGRGHRLRHIRVVVGG
jgi:hypothetical protein